MTKTKWLRRALLGGVAVTVMAANAQAGELTDLKAQLEALQARVNTLETAPAPQMPAGASYMTFSRGQGSLANWGNEAKRDAANNASNRGFTVAITPTADMPAPVAEVTVYGYVKGDVMWSNENGWDRSFSAPSFIKGSDSEWDIQANQSRFGIKSKIDTAIGQIRTKIEGDFEGSPYGTTSNFRLRHAYGEWDMTPNWTLLVGQYWHLGSLLPLGVSTVDFAGSAGPTYSRSPQVRLTYHSGPITWAVGIGDPLEPGGDATADYPNFGAYFQYDAAGGHQLFAGAEVADSDIGLVSGTSWAIGGGANINLGDIATFTTGAWYGKGVVARRYLGQEGFNNFDVFLNPAEMWGFLAGVQFAVSETTTVNVQFGYSDNLESAATTLTGIDDVMTVHANIMWRPVKQMRLGWEVIWGNVDAFAAGFDNSAVRAQFGAWFFF